MILRVLVFCCNVLILCSCQSQERIGAFNLNGKSTISVKNDTQKPIVIEIENWYLLPYESQKIDTSLLVGDSIHFQLITQGNSYFDITIDEKRMKVFSQPNASIRLNLSEGQNEVQFSGDLKTINQFIQRKSVDFTSPDSDWLPRVNFTQMQERFTDLIKANDSITNLHLDYLFQHRSEFPNWYVEFENKRLKYLNAHWKLNSLMYRKRMMNKSDSLPGKFLEKTIGDLAVNDKSMIGNARYMNFLSDYIGYSTDPQYQKEKPSSMDEWIQFYEEQIEVTNTLLVGEVKNTYLTFLLGNVLENRKHIFQENWILNISNKDLITYLREVIISNPTLPQGAKVPYFYLMDSIDSYNEPSDFKGKIVLINFWATWCKPCIMEFPYDNQLVDQFENESVDIINICIDSNYDSWKKGLKKYALKTINLFAQEEWNNTIKKNFGILELPHSILIDWKGQVVQNKCPRASENVDKLITQLLIDKKKADNK